MHNFFDKNKKQRQMLSSTITTQKTNKDFFSKCDQIRRRLWIWSHILKKSLMENFTFCVVYYSSKGKAKSQFNKLFGHFEIGSKYIFIFRLLKTSTFTRYFTKLTDILKKQRSGTLLRGFKFKPLNKNKNFYTKTF